MDNYNPYGSRICLGPSKAPVWWAATSGWLSISRVIRDASRVIRILRSAWRWFGAKLLKLDLLMTTRCSPHPLSCRQQSDMFYDFFGFRILFHGFRWASMDVTPASYLNDDPNDYFNLKTFRMALARPWAAPGRPRRPPGR